MSHSKNRSCFVEAAAAKLRPIAAKLMKLPEMKEFMDYYLKIINEYENTPHLSISSTGIYLEKLPLFQQLLPYFTENKNKIIPNLVFNMLKGDIYAESIYRIIIESTGNNDTLLSYKDIYNDPVLYKEYSDLSGGQESYAILNAEKWLTTQNAAEIFHVNCQTKELCDITTLLGVNNPYASC